MLSIATVVLTLAVATDPQPAATQNAQASDASPSTVALVERYADGRTVYELVSARPARMWTPAFPAIKDWQPPAGSLPVAALQLARVLVGRDVRVDVSVLLGRTHEQEVAVTTVLVHPGAHVIVNELRAFGVEPVDLSLAEAAPLTPYLPTVFTVTPELEIASVELLNAPYPGYRITVRSLASKAAATFGVQSYRGEQKALSTIRRGPEGRPVLTPGGTHTFDMNLTGGNVTAAGLSAPTPLDVIEIDSVLWEDGTSNGSLSPAASAIVIDAGRRLQLTRIVEALRNAIAERGSIDMMGRARALIEAVPDVDDARLSEAQTSMRLTKRAALEDLRRFEQDRSMPHDADAVRDWLQRTIARYETWISRLSPL